MQIYFRCFTLAVHFDTMDEAYGKDVCISFFHVSDKCQLSMQSSGFNQPWAGLNFPTEITVEFRFNANI